MKESPYISFVVTSRNDDHGGDMKKRMNIFIRGLIHQCNKHKLNAELLLVDWNTPGNEKNLHEILPLSTEKDFLQMRFIIVPEDIHQKMRFSEHLGLYQMIAKNVGIRRAKASFILCTNVDLLFSDDLIERLSKKKLEEGKFYRANRCDVPDKFKDDWDVEQQLHFCSKNIVKRLGKNPMFPNIEDTSSRLYNQKSLYPLIQKYSELKSSLGFQKDEMAEMDTDACGDFTLMSKKDWFKIRGYPELEMYSLHIDSMALYACVAQSIEQIIFDPSECTYHIEHESGWNMEKPIERIKFLSKRPSLDWFSVHEAGLEIIKNKSHFSINDPDTWGLNNVELKEISFHE